MCFTYLQITRKVYIMNDLIMHSPLHNWKKGEFPVSPFVAIAVGAHTESDGKILLSPNLMTDLEVDYEVNRLIKNLEKFRSSAKKELKSLQSKMLEK